MFVEAKSKLQDIELDRAIVALAKYEKISLISTVQFLHLIPKVQKILEKADKKVFVGKPSLHAVKEGQVLGCDATSANNVPEEIDAVLYMGTGRFHPLGAAYKFNTPVIRLDPFSGETEIISEKDVRRWQLKQQARILKAKEAKVYGILVTLKLGQNEMQGKAFEIKKKLEQQDKQAYIFISDTINSQELRNFPKIECWISTACPRMVDDQDLYNKPIVNVEELAL